MVGLCLSALCSPTGAQRMAQDDQKDQCSSECLVVTKTVMMNESLHQTLITKSHL